MSMSLIRPTETHIVSYRHALEKGWSMDLRGAAAAVEQLANVRAAPLEFLAGLDDPDGVGGEIKLPDGSSVPRLPGLQRWLWDGEFCGAIGLRWAPGTAELPEYCLGHIGYGVVPWKQRRGYATAALAQILPEAMAVGLPHVDLTTDPENTASQKVILRNGGTLLREFTKAIQFGGKPGLLFRIQLSSLPAGAVNR